MAKEIKAIESPLSVDQATVKEFGIPKEIELTPRQKVAFLEAQLQELQASQFRSRVDVVHSVRLSQDENEVLRNKGLERVSIHKNEVRQFTGGIVMIQNMIKQLKEEYKAELED